MLSFSKDREPSLEPADLNETVGEVVELMQSRAEELKVKLTWEPCETLPEIQIDADGIHRAVLNIITNAIDASEEAVGAQVVVSTTFDESKGLAFVRVVDNGVGFAQEEGQSIFELFASTKGSRGTGLGLPVSRKIVREHGGDIVATSEPGRGSTFTIELPLRHGESRPGGTGDMATMG
jgi:signal transduction histidine kinase